MFRLEDLGPPRSHQEKVAFGEWFENLKHRTARSWFGEDMHRRTDEDVARLEAIEEAREAARQESLAKAKAEAGASTYSDESMATRFLDIFRPQSEIDYRRSKYTAGTSASDLKSAPEATESSEKLREERARAEAERAAQAAASKEMARLEAAKQEAARQEAARQEAARQEAADKQQEEKALNEHKTQVALLDQYKREQALKDEEATNDYNNQVALLDQYKREQALKEDTIPASAYARPKSLLNNPYVQGGIGLAGTAGLLYALDSATRD